MTIYTPPRPLVYLGGPIGGLSYAAAVRWRHDAAIIFDIAGIEAISPMRDKEHLQGSTNLDGPGMRGAASESDSFIVARDRSDVRRSSVVLMNYLDAVRPSNGSHIETGWCDAFRIPLVIAAEPGNPNLDPMSRGIAAAVVPTLAEAIRLCASIAGGRAP